MMELGLFDLGLTGTVRGSAFTPLDLPGLSVAVWAGTGNQYTSYPGTLATVVGTDEVERVVRMGGTSTIDFVQPGGGKPIYEGSNGSSFHALGTDTFGFSPSDISLDLSDNTKQGTIIVSGSIASSSDVITLIGHDTNLACVVYDNSVYVLDDLSSGGNFGSGFSGNFTVWIYRKVGDSAITAISRGGSTSMSLTTFGFNQIGGSAAGYGVPSTSTSKVKGLFVSSTGISPADSPQMVSWLSAQGYPHT